jgi:hypothetical protein
MYTGPDTDIVPYTCGSVDGVMFSGKCAITNRLLPENVLESYNIHGKKPDKGNIYDMTEFLMQSICADMTAREFLVDKFTQIDDMLYTALVDAQVKAKSGLLIIKGKVKVFKPVPTNSDIANIIKKEAEHRQSTRTAGEQQKLDKKMAELSAAKQEAEDELSRSRNKAVEHRLADTQSSELERAEAKLRAEQVHQTIQHEMKLATAMTEASQQTIAANATAFSYMVQQTAEANATKLEAAANQELLTPQYLEYKRSESLGKINKAYYGKEVDKIFQIKTT